MGAPFIALPIWLAAAGLLASFVGFFFVSTNEEGEGKNANIGRASRMTN